jgi:hypothetical protein
MILSLRVIPSLLLHEFASRIEERTVVDVIAKAKMGEIIWAQLDPDGDLYDEIMEI